MDNKLQICGGCQLKGEVSASGSKNSAVAVIPAAILLNGACRIENIPDISDVCVMIDILHKLGAKVDHDKRNGSLEIDTSGIQSFAAPFSEAKSVRASSYLLGSLLGRFKEAQVPMPGGCDFGYRPIDQHIKGFEAMGASFDMVHGLMTLKALKLEGASIYLDVISVGATINLMMAAVMAEGTTIIENAAKEPHVVDLANFLNAAGAGIKGAGTDVIRIRGVSRLHGNFTHAVIPDQIETGTLMIAAAATGGIVTVNNVIPKHMESLSAKLSEIGVEVEEDGDSIRVLRHSQLRKANIKTLPYPGFPTDLHPQMAVLLCLADGTSTINESVWDLRFQYVEQLSRMGADMHVEGRIAIIRGPVHFTGTSVDARDLRAGAAMVIAGLVASGETTVENVRYIDRGYEKFSEKLAALGANIRRI
ncbi:MAG TPA: UDP-N-acetylglucosamine 1-carboxyvinyltransferase [Clostridiales bacterium]|nr:UDP-N-acetylglucosamine 1-carboxyvinyltransferase [Clostridiales bacterium]